MTDAIAHNDATGSDAQTDMAACLAAVERQLALLQEELSETNQGVVALYAELDDRNGQLRQISDLKSRFLSYMSHECAEIHTEWPDHCTGIDY